MAEQEIVESGTNLPEIRHTQPATGALTITPEYIQQTTRSLALIQGMIQENLQDGRDYGHVPGVQGSFLWDPGASLIMSSFNCHTGQRRIIHFEDNDERVAVIVEVPVIDHMTGREVASGIGASSTLETKHKYRWVGNPSEWGYNEEAKNTLKTRTGEDGKVFFRILNPEHDELLNTIIKQASKRAEVDASQGLPGVASALRELFDPHGKKSHPQQSFGHFWGLVKGMGLTEDATHKMLGVDSLKDWMGKGYRLDEAVIVIGRKMVNFVKKVRETTGVASGVTPPKKQLEDITAADVPDVNTLLSLAKEHFGFLEGRVWREAGYDSRPHFENVGTETPYDVFCTLKVISVAPEKPPAAPQMPEDEPPIEFF